MNSPDSNQPGTHEHEVLPEKTVTFRYRLYHYKNGLNEDVWQISRKGFLGFYWLVLDEEVVDDVTMEWNSRKSATEWIQQDADKRRESLNNRRIFGKRTKLRLIVREDVVA